MKDQNRIPHATTDMEYVALSRKDELIAELIPLLMRCDAAYLRRFSDGLRDRLDFPDQHQPAPQLRLVRLDSPSPSVRE